MAKTPRKIPSQVYLKECFEYNAETGEMWWKMRPVKHFKSEASANRWNARYAEKNVGTRRPDDLRDMVCIAYEHLLKHRVIWKLMTGNDPKDQIDHINGDRTDYRFSNLREATHAQNLYNIGRNKRNTSGYKGVYWTKVNRNFVARIRVDGKYKHLGSFEYALQAYYAYCKAAIQYHGEFARLS
jgi:hypothetical protein